MSYIVIESTPGYLPEDDDPAVFDRISDAIEYAQERLAALIEHIEDGQSFDFVEGEIPGVRFMGELSYDKAVVVYDNSREHDLGRVIEIVEVDANGEPL